jgi:hypothetical protein
MSNKTRVAVTQTQDLIPQAVIDAYVARFPGLRHLAARIGQPPPGTARLAARTFAQNACRLAAAPGVSVRQIYALAGVAEGLDWQEPDEG